MTELFPCPRKAGIGQGRGGNLQVIAREARFVMNNQFVADGPERFAESESFQSRRRALWRQVEGKHATELARAGFFRRLAIRYLRFVEFRRELRKITPSPESCWVCAG
jgi:hypothetical protein